MSMNNEAVPWGENNTDACREDLSASKGPGPADAVADDAANADISCACRPCSLPSSRGERPKKHYEHGRYGGNPMGIETDKGS